MNGYTFLVCMICLYPVVPGTQAQAVNQCEGNPCTNGGNCTGDTNTYSCTCTTGYSGTNCETDINECSQNNNCDVNAVCSNTAGSYTCACKTGYTGSGFSCRDINECASNPCLNGGTCSNLVDAYRCSCATGYTGQECHVASLGASCSVSGTICNDQNARCQSSGVGKSCQCMSSYYDDDGTGTIGGTCRYRKAVGVACSTPVYNKDQCSDENALCKQQNNSSPYKCTCNTRYHQESTGCVADKALGGSCNQTSQEVECSDPAASCLGSKCTCNYSHYDSNGLKLNGVCSPITNLKVTNVGFTSIQTNQMRVTWSAPENYETHISGFTVQWKPLSNIIVGESQNLASSVSTLTLTRGIDPGRAYTVTIISKNDKTEQGFLRSTSVIRYQAAKPGITNGIDVSRSDTDTSGGTITVHWLAPPGYISSYNVRLVDGTTVFKPFSLSLAGSEATFTSTQLKNGYRYNVTIQALSEANNNVQVVLGEIVTEEFKTTPKAPGPPQKGLCKDPTDNSITLSWKAPAVPNGDLVRYHIHVYSYSSRFLFNVTTLGTETEKAVGSLEPGTGYRFQIYTENEKYQSSSSEPVTDCKTNAKMSDPPSDLKTTVVSSRNITITWNGPINIYSEENYGYVLQLENDKECVEEAVYRCSNCRGTFQPLELERMCSSVVRDTFSKTKSELDDLQTYQFLNLQPDTAYTISVTAVTNLGRGNTASIVQTTFEEAPQSLPYNVEVSDIETTSFRVSWRMDEPRPGQTNFTITVYADKPAATKEFSVKGFTTRSFIAQGLEEYWSYSVTVTAATSVGAKTSDATLQYRTLPAAPGKISNFEITNAPGGNYSKMQISWNAPAILQRNGVIKNYNLIYFPSKKTPVKKVLAHTFVETFMYIATVDVIPGEIYSVEVYATNEQELKGESTTKFTQAPTEEKSRTGCDCDSATNSIIIGVVLGALLLIVSAYAGYATLVIRRYKTNNEFPESSKARPKERRGPIYANETFMIGETVKNDSSDPTAVRHSETEYTRLDENTKDDKGTYDIIQAM